MAKRNAPTIQGNLINQSKRYWYSSNFKNENNHYKFQSGLSLALKGLAGLVTAASAILFCEMIKGESHRYSQEQILRQEELKKQCLEKGKTNLRYSALNGYHCINELDLFKIVTTLEKGVLTKKSADKEGIDTVSTTNCGRGLLQQGDEHVSSLIFDNPRKYSDYNPSTLFVIFNSCGLKTNSTRDLLPSQLREGYDDYIDYNKTHIEGNINADRISGIIIPDNFLKSDLSELDILDIDSYGTDIPNLDSFFKKQFNISFLLDPVIKKYYDEGVAATQERNDFHHAQPSKYRLRSEISNDLNQSLRTFIDNLYKLKLGKSTVTALDILQYHVDGKLPIFKLNGEMIQSSPHKLEETSMSARLSR